MQLVYQTNLRHKSTMHFEIFNNKDLRYASPYEFYIGEICKGHNHYNVNKLEIIFQTFQHQARKKKKECIY